MSSKALEGWAMHLMEDAGFQVESIPEADGKRPDFRASAEGDNYLFEVKDKSYPGARDTAFFKTSSGYSRSDPLLRSNSISRKAYKAAKQIGEMASEEDLRLLWFFPVGPHDNLLYKQLRYTLFGLKIAVVQGGPLSGSTRECYFADHAEFFRQRERLDGAVVGSLRILLMNPLSPRMGRLRDSRLAAVVRGVEDPVVQVEASNAFLLRSDVDRGNIQAVEEALRIQLEAKRVELTNLIGYSAIIG